MCTLSVLTAVYYACILVHPAVSIWLTGLRLRLATVHTTKTDFSPLAGDYKRGYERFLYYILI